MHGQIKEATVLVSNFLKMPVFLRFLTGIALLFILFDAQSVLSDVISIQGLEISRSEWWGNGSGLIQVLSSLPLIIAAFLLLARSRYARISYLLGWLISNVGTAFILQANGAMAKGEMWLFVILGSAVSLIVFACYLFMSKQVAAYVKGEIPKALI